MGLDMGRIALLLAAALAACGEAPAPRMAAPGEALRSAVVELRDVELTTSAEGRSSAINRTAQIQTCRRLRSTSATP